MNVYSHTVMLFYSRTNHHSDVKKLFLRLWVWAFITLSLSVGREVNRAILDGWALVASLCPPPPQRRRLRYHALHPHIRTLAAVPRWKLLSRGEGSLFLSAKKKTKNVGHRCGLACTRREQDWAEDPALRNIRTEVMVEDV